MCTQAVSEAINRLEGLKLTRVECSTALAIMFGNPPLPKPVPKSGYMTEKGVKYRIVKKGTVLPTDHFRNSQYEEWCLAGGTERPVSPVGEFRRKVGKR